ncbi:MAG TPA: hypothetical protein VIK74_01300 [Parasegetibacter sp.]|jgi:hypothetical protein
MEKQSFKIQVTNLSEKPTTFRLEPWGDEKELLVNESVIIQAEGPREGVLEVEYSEKLITIYGWAGSICEVEEH